MHKNKRAGGLYVLCGIAPPPHISDGQSHPSLRNTHSKTTICVLSISKIQPERDSNQDTCSVLHSVEHRDGSARTGRLPLWSSHFHTTPSSSPSAPRNRYLQVRVRLVKFKSPPERERTMQALMQKCGFNEDGQAVYECGDEQTVDHLLVCPILPQPYTSLVQCPRRPGKVQP